MVDFKAKIKAQKSKDRERAGKKRKSVEGHRMPSAPRASIPSARKREDNSAAIMKGVTDLFKDKDIDIPTGSEVQELEDYVSGYGNPIGDGPADVSFGPLYEGAGYSVFKKGGRLKKAGKRKRAALRGQRSELRGS
jgi:hypothetical protein